MWIESYPLWLEEVPLTVDPTRQWITDHPEEVAKHQGQRVAIHPERGIVASGDTLDEVYEEVRRLGFLDVVTFDSIPWGYAP